MNRLYMLRLIHLLKVPQAPCHEKNNTGTIQLHADIKRLLIGTRFHCIRWE